MPIALVVGACCLVAYSFVEERSHPTYLILSAPFLVALVSGSLGGSIALVCGVSWQWALAVVAIPLSVIGFGGGCGISLAQMIRLYLRRSHPEWSVKENLPRGSGIQEMAETGGTHREDVPRDAYVTGDSRQGMQMKRPDQPGDQREPAD
jgi:hypothetical protein